jgi:prepilin-type N-terminal cleavage/methylation domain-containing protein
MFKINNITGFTLIELLIVISIIMLVTGGGIAGFVSFNDRQQVQTSVREIQTLMRSAQIKARSGEGAADCVPPQKLYGYRVTASTTNVIMSRYCVNPADPSDNEATERSRVTLNNVSLILDPDWANSVTFLTLRGGIDMGATNGISYTVAGEYSGISYSFRVLDTGEIVQGEFN